MPPLSIPEELPPDPLPDEPREGGASRLALIARVGIPVLVGGVLAAVLLVEGTGLPERDLQLYAPYAARPGRTVAVRGLLFDQVDRPEGPALLDVPVHVQLEDPAGRVLAEGRLRPSRVAGTEGALSVPAAASGLLTLTARVQIGEEELVVRRELSVSEDAATPQGQGRLLSPLQHYRAFDVRPEGDAVPPAPLEPRVVGGACTPGRRCEILVWVGAPAATVEIEPSPAVEPREPFRSTSTEGVVPLALSVRGLEADLHLVARRDGAVVARRTVRLPVDQSMPAVSVGSRLLLAPARPEVRAEHPVAPEAVVVDAYRDGVWERTGSLAAEEAVAGAPLPFEPLDPGLWRLQVRTDAFDSSSAAVRFVFVRDRETDARAALDALVERSAALGWNDPFAAAVDRDEPRVRSDPETTAGFLLAAGERELLPMPRPSSSYVRAAAGAGERAGMWRWIAAGVVVLAGILAGVILLQQGIRASDEARGLMREAGEPGTEAPNDRRRQVAAVAAVAVFVVLLFVAVALFVLASR